MARNIGDIPLDITLVEIYPPQGYYWPGSSLLKQGESCEGFGFRILNCNPFSLQPNETHSIDIAYTPDFTMSRMVRSLRLIDSNGVVCSLDEKKKTVRILIATLISSSTITILSSL